MPCDPNVTKAKRLVLLARNDADTEWEIVGGVKTRGVTFDNPVEDTTSSSTLGDYSESEWTGYSQVTISASGVADRRTGEIDPATGYTIVGSQRFTQMATSGNRCGKLKMINLDLNGSCEGEFNITSFGKTGDTPGLLNFEATFQSKADITVVGDF